MNDEMTKWVPAGRCSLIAADMVGFGRLRRNLQVQIYLRARLYELIERSSRKSGLDIRRTYSEDRGDGFILAVPPDVPTEQLIHPFLEYVRAGLRLHNQVSNELAQLRLRIAVHCGEARTDEHGLVGDSVTHLCRLLEAPSFKRVTRESGAHLAVIASSTVYEEILWHAPDLIDPDDYAKIDVKHKELSGSGWVRLVGRPAPVDQPA
jgi:class 3 adenylate cyclase